MEVRKSSEIFKDDAIFTRDRFTQIRFEPCDAVFGDEKGILFGPDADRHVVQIGIEANGSIGRQRPGSCCPNQGVELNRATRVVVVVIVVVDDGKFDVDRYAAMVVVVFQLGFGQRRSRRRTPINRHKALVDASTLFRKKTECYGSDRKSDNSLYPDT